MSSCGWLLPDIWNKEPSEGFILVDVDAIYGGVDVSLLAKIPLMGYDAARMQNGILDWVADIQKGMIEWQVPRI